MRLLGFILAFLWLVPVITLALNTSSIWCYDNQTLGENVTVYVGNNMTTASIYNYCAYGCDNITNSCSPTEYEANIYNMGIIIVIIIGLALLYKYGRH